MIEKDILKIRQNAIKIVYKILFIQVFYIAVNIPFGVYKVNNVYEAFFMLMFTLLFLLSSLHWYFRIYKRSLNIHCTHFRKSDSCKDVFLKTSFIKYYKDGSLRYRRIFISLSFFITIYIWCL